MLTRDPITSEMVAPPRLPTPNERRELRRGPSGRLEWALVLLVFLGSFAFRFFTLEFDNDHFQTIAEGRQVLVYGELPFRDFVDPGFFLMPLSSAAVQLLFGYNLLGEAIFTVGLLSAGATLTFLLASRASGSLLVGAAAAIAVVAMYPRLYHYPKVFLLVLGLFAGWRYADRATPGNLVTLALCTALAFLFRHDHGVYVGLAAVVLLIARHWQDGRRVLLRRLGLYAGVGAVAVLPFFVFLEANGGILEYFRSALEYTRSEAKRQRAFAPPAFVLEPSSPPRVNVRWKEGLSADARARLEERHKLTAARSLGGRTWEYELGDSSPTNLRAVVNDPGVEDTHNINRATSRTDGSSLQGILDSWQRRIGLEILQKENAIAWLYYLFVSLPIMAVGVLLVSRVRARSTTTSMPYETAKVLSAAALCAVATGLLLRDPLVARLPDLAAPTAVIGAWLVGRWLNVGACSPPRDQGSRDVWRPTQTTVSASRMPRLLCLGQMAAMLALAGVTWASILAVADADERFEETAILSGPTALLKRGAEIVSTLAESPPAEAWAPTRRNVPLVRYIETCTKPTDRVLVTSFQPDVYFFSGRAFAGDQIFFYLEYRTSPEDQQRTLAGMQEQSVPVVLADGRRYEADIQSEFSLIHDYLTQHYRLAREVQFDKSDPVIFRVLVDRRITPTGTYEPLSLPCFR
ncbi:MAG: hypothetical protein H0V51_14945 [Chloroflexi bacterium]|nr:hypothetical protein [Chloroflexota bacterium]